MTPRTAARQYLPDLDRDWPEWQRRFGHVRLEYLTTPAGTWDSRPDWIKAAVPFLPADPTQHSPSLWVDGKPPRRTRK